jgi:hypothetical protein
MIRISPNSIVYVVCPLDIQTGGTELCHQLVDNLNNKGIISYMTYVSKDFNIIDAQIPSGFKKYNVKVCAEIVNTKENIIVFPETYMFLIKKLNVDKMSYIFWWMSLDNYFNISSIFGYLKFSNKTFKGIISKTINFITRRYPIMTFADLRKIEGRSLNVFQSTYVNQFLLNQKIYNQLALSDYINLEFLNLDSTDVIKEDIILYNPLKGFKITKKIINKMEGFNFVPLVNLNRSQLSALMRRAKLYIDFGNHPGKDRIPREAVMNNCCIIVGKNGSARFFQDLPIYEDYKFDNQDVELVCERIAYVMNNYNKCISDFDFIKKRIYQEKSIFEEEIDKIFFKDN